MRRFFLLIAVAGVLGSGSPLLGQQPEVKPLQVVEAGCKHTYILGVSPDSKRVWCFDYWDLTQIDLTRDKEDKRLPLPPQLRGFRICNAVHVEDYVWILDLARAKPMPRDAADIDHRLVLFDFAANAVKAEWGSPTTSISALMLAPRQGQLVVAGVDGVNDLLFWDLKERKKSHQMNVLQDWGLEGPLGGLKQRTVLDPTSSFLACGLVDEGKVSVWDLDKKAWHPVVPAAKGVFLGPLTFVDSRTLAGVWGEAATGKEQLEVYDWRAGKRLFQADVKGQLSSIVGSPDRRTLALWYRDVNKRESWIHLWDVAKKRELTAFKAHEQYIQGMTFTKDGKKLITCDDDGIIKVWDVDRFVNAPKPEQVPR